MCLAVPGRIVAIEGEDPLERTAEVDFGGVLRSVSLACVPEAGLGDHVLVHVGLAISVVDEEAARRTRELLAEAALGEPASGGPASQGRAPRPGGPRRRASRALE